LNLSQREASTIADKLGATRKQKRNHEVVYIRANNGVLLGRYGIQRASKSLSHDYIPAQIKVSMREAIQLAQCPMSRDDYLELMRRKGHI
jgi:RNase adaptor protein for sRNA GlmZ degradation